MAYGASTDKFGLADTNWKLQDYGSDFSSSQAQALDQYGDVACETTYDTGTSYSNTYMYCGSGDSSGNVVFPTVNLGEDTGNAVYVTGATVETSNTDWPKLTITGETTAGSPGIGDTVTFPSVAAGKVATALGCTADTGSYVQSSSWSRTVQIQYGYDSDGARCIASSTGDRIEATTEVVACTGTPGVTIDTAFTQSGGGLSESNTGYATYSATMYDIP